jgi:ATP-dependent Clp protease ATP-binding subunit ClpA
MLELERSLAKRLKQMRVRVDAPDDNTVFLRNVPVGERFFNKSRTNLLIKRPQKGMPFLACVDEDLEYMGSDAIIARAFRGGHKQQGWRVLLVGQAIQEDFQSVVSAALKIIGFDECEPKMELTVTNAEAPGRPSLLSIFGDEVTARANAEQGITVRREEEIEGALSALLQWQRRLPVIVGESGVGKTNLIYGVARRLAKVRPELRIVSVDLGIVMAGTLFDSERENLLASLIKDSKDSPGTILAIEHIEMCFMGVPRGLFILSDALDSGIKLIATSLPNHLCWLETAPLARRLHILELGEMSIGETEEVLLSARDQIGRHHKVVIDDALIKSAIDASLGLAGRLPTKAIALLDAAAARAVLSNENRVGVYDLYTAASQFHEG